MNCHQCGKEITGEGIAFCPYCGAKLQQSEPEKSRETNPEVAEWVRKAQAVTSLPERKKILEKAKAAYPDAPEIDWEMLFIGHPDPKPPRGRMDFSIIKSWLLQIYREPGSFSDEKRDQMRKELFEDPALLKSLAISGDPEGKLQEYLERLCREYIEIFMEEDSRLMGNIFGFRLTRNKEKVIAVPVSEMIRRMEADEKLTPDQRGQLRQAMIRAFADRMGGKTEFLNI